MTYQTLYRRIEVYNLTTGQTVGHFNAKDRVHAQIHFGLYCSDNKLDPTNHDWDFTADGYDADGQPIK